MRKIQLEVPNLYKNPKGQLALVLYANADHFPRTQISYARIAFESEKGPVSTLQVKMPSLIGLWSATPECIRDWPGCSVVY